MKLTSLNAFEKHLEGAAPKHFTDVYLLMSPEAYHRSYGAEKACQLFFKGSGGPTPLNYQAFDAERHSIGNIIGELNTMSFFGSKRMIVVHNIEAFDKSALEALEKYVGAPSASICLVLTSKGLHRASSLYKKLEKVGVVLDVAEEKSWEKEKTVTEWLVNTCRAQGKQIAPRAADMMVKRLGTDQTLLSNELNKLLCYVGVRPTVEQADVVAICSCSPMENAWQLGEAIFNRDAASAIRIGRSQLSGDTALIPLLRQLRTQFQTDFHVCTLLQRGATSADITQEYPYMRGAILDRHIQQARGYGIEKFKSGILAIDKAEIDAKNSSLDPEFIFDVLVVRLTT